MSDTKYTKKASSRIIKELQKINPKAPLSTTYDQAFVELMTAWDLELGIEKDANIVKSSIHKDGTVSHSFEWSVKDAWDDKEYDFEWNFIYRTILEHIIKTRLYKRPKVGKRELARIAKEKAAIKQAEKEAKAAAKAAKEQEKLEKAKKRAIKKTK